MIKNITNLGDAALYCDFGEDVNIEKNLEVIKYFNEIKNLNIDGVLNITPSYNKLIISLDLGRLVSKLKLDKEDIIKTFLSKKYFCYMTGFIAGMPFLGDISDNLRLKRLSTPRVKVPKGSIGITEQFCNIYSFESPGGWNIIGRTPLKVFDKQNQFKPKIKNALNTFIRMINKWRLDVKNMNQIILNN